MKTQLKRILIGCGIVAAGISLTACNTVQGTAQGASQDLQAVGNAANPQPTERPMHKKTMHKKTMHKKMHKTETTSSNNAGEATQTSQSTSTTETNKTY